MIELQTVFDPSFFEEETESGFLITKERKQLWAVELDLLLQLDRVCRGHDIPYMLGAGTLLGAVRHKGFIPWDDDIDVYLLRKDYDRLMALSDCFGEPYFLQNAYTDRFCFGPFSKLRNSNTTGFETNKDSFNSNFGIFIDIFPIDGICEDAKKNRRQKRLDWVYKGFLKYYGFSSVETVPNKMKKLLASVVIAIVGIERFSHAMEKNLSRYSKPGTRLWGNRSIHFDCPRSRRPLEDYTNLIETEFEGFQFPIPANYDAMLTQQYGDYMTIPKKRPGSLHGGLVFSTDTPYREYFMQREKEKQEHEQ